MTAGEIREAMVGEQESELWAAVLDLVTTFRQAAIEGEIVGQTSTEQLWKAAGAVEALGNFRLELEEQMRTANEPKDEKGENDQGQ